MYALYLAPTEESVQTYPVPKCFLSLWMKYMKNAKDEKINESFGIWKKIPRFVVSLLLNWLDFWYGFYNFFEPAITSFP